jgi:hypothetical protein
MPFFHFALRQHNYPYQETVVWLRDTHREDTILFTGLDYRYYLNFYFEKLNWHPDYYVIFVDQNKGFHLAFSESLAEVQEMDINVIVYHILDEELKPPNEINSYFLEKTFKNQTHTILVYTKTQP